MGPAAKPDEARRPDGEESPDILLRKANFLEDPPLAFGCRVQKPPSAFAAGSGDFIHLLKQSLLRKMFLLLQGFQLAIDGRRSCESQKCAKDFAVSGFVFAGLRSFHGDAVLSQKIVFDRAPAPANLQQLGAGELCAGKKTEEAADFGGFCDLAPVALESMRSAFSRLFK